MKFCDIGFRDLKTIKEEKSTPEQFRNQFKAVPVSENRFERRVEELMTTTNECTVRDHPLSRRESQQPDQKVSFTGFIEELKQTKAEHLILKD